MNNVKNTTVEEIFRKQDEKTGKYGYVNAEEKVMIPFIYEKATTFESGYAMVLDQEQHLRKFIDKSGKIVFELECEGAFQPIQGKTVFCRNKKWGVVDITNGKMVLPCKYDEIITDCFEYNNKVFFLLGQKNKMGLTNIEFSTVLPCKYDEITACKGKEKPHINFFVLRQKEKIGLANIELTTILPCEYDGIKEIVIGGNKFFIKLFKKDKVGLAEIGEKITIIADPLCDDVRVKQGRGNNKGKYGIEHYFKDAERWCSVLKLDMIGNDDYYI